MSVAEETRVEQMVCRLLSDVGIRRTGQAYAYLSCALLLVLDGVQPGPELWATIARKYGKRAVNVRDTCRLGIQSAYRNDPEQFCAALDDVYFFPPRTRDFIAVVSRRLRASGSKL